jgi:hypothetical protein
VLIPVVVELIAARFLVLRRLFRQPAVPVKGEDGNTVKTEFVSFDGVIQDLGGVEGFKLGVWVFEINRGEDGDKVNGLPKYVASSTLGDPVWNNTRVPKRTS